MNTPLNDALKPCPMCGKSVASVTTSSEMFAEYDDGNADSFAVMCDASAPNGPGGCGASGGFHPTEAEAIAAWNTRANTPESSEVVITTNQQGVCVAVTRQDEDGRILSVIWEAPESSAAQGAMGYRFEFCGYDEKSCYRIFDSNGNGVCYARTLDQAIEVTRLLNAQPSDATAQPDEHEKESAVYWSAPYENAKDFANRNIGTVQNAYIGETGEHLDAGTAYAIAESMFSLLANTAQDKPDEDAEIVAHIIENGLQGSTYHDITSINVLVDVSILETEGPRAALVAALAAKKG